MLQDILYPDYGFIEEVNKGGDFQAEACFQCRKCTNGCPVSFAMDLFPDEVIRMVLLGERQKVLNCNTIWICAACETCTTRCPNEVKIAELMDYLKEMAISLNIPCPQPQVLTLHKEFLKNINKYGRIFEPAFLSSYMLRSGKFFKKLRDGSWRAETLLGWKLFSKGRMPLFPRKIRRKREVDRILKETYPT